VSLASLQLSRTEAEALLRRRLARIYALEPVRFATSMGLTPDPWQAQALGSTAKRKLLNCSRQAGKSTIAAIGALHRALFSPGSLTLLVSQSLRQSRELFGKIVDLVRLLSERPKLDEDNKLSMRLTSGSRIVSLPSNPGTIRGFSAVDELFVDEAAFVRDELYGAIRPMLAVSGGTLTLMSTPFGKRVFFHEEWVNGGSDWERYEVPWNLCPRIAPAFIAQELKSRGEWFVDQEYRCKFVETVDSVFMSEDIRAAFDEAVQEREL